jgi:hypothetical protein
MATKAQFTISNNDPLDVAIWKLMADHKERTATEIGVELAVYGFDRIAAKDRAIALMRRQWFKRNETNKVTYYSLKKGIPMPVPEKKKPEPKKPAAKKPAAKPAAKPAVKEAPAADKPVLFGGLGLGLITAGLAKPAGAYAPIPNQYSAPPQKDAAKTNKKPFTFVEKEIEMAIEFLRARPLLVQTYQPFHVYKETLEKCFNCEMLLPEIDGFLEVLVERKILRQGVGMSYQVIPAAEPHPKDVAQQQQLENALQLGRPKLTLPHKSLEQVRAERVVAVDITVAGISMSLLQAVALYQDLHHHGFTNRPLAVEQEENTMLNVTLDILGKTFTRAQLYDIAEEMQRNGFGKLVLVNHARRGPFMF